MLSEFIKVEQQRDKFNNFLSMGCEHNQDMPLQTLSLKYKL